MVGVVSFGYPVKVGLLPLRTTAGASPNPMVPGLVSTVISVSDSIGKAVKMDEMISTGASDGVPPPK